MLLLILTHTLLWPQSGNSKSANDASRGDRRSKVREAPTLDKPGLDDSGREPGQPFKFGVEVDLVVLAVSVVDREGNFIGGLQQNDFAVSEDKAPQTISHFAQVDIPITIGLVLDISGSMRTRIAMVNQAALAFLKLSNPKDETFLVAFNDEVDLVEDFTEDLDTIRDALDNLIVSGGTSLHDAVLLATQKARKGSRQKHALLVITDGEDRDSYYKLEEVLKVIQESNVQVFMIGLVSPKGDEGLFDIFRKSPQEKAQNAISRIAQETGAKAVFPKDVSELPAIMEKIAFELRNQYHLGYASTNSRMDGSWRTVQISLPQAAHKMYRPRTRSGYYAPRAPGP